MLCLPARGWLNSVIFKNEQADVEKWVSHSNLHWVSLSVVWIAKSLSLNHLYYCLESSHQSAIK